MRREASVTLFQYWNRLRDGRAAPKRTEIEPADIKSLLGDTFILESDSRGEAVFRLAGTRLCAIYGRELKGFAFSSLWRDKDARLIARLVRSVFQEKSVLVMTYEGISRGQRSLSLELLLLPLDGGTENRRALGIVSTESKPYWLGADPVTEAAVETVRVVDPDREPMFLKNRPAVEVPSLAPTLGAAGIDPAGDGVRRIRHLLVLPGGRSE
jgi:hypothetical protein